MVLSDEFDPVIVEAFRSQPAALSSIQALRAAFKLAFSKMAADETAAQRDRMLLVVSVPELRAAMLDQFASAMELLSAIVAERTGRASNDLQVRTLAGAVVGAAMAAMFAMAEDPEADLAAKLDDSMACLEAGFHL